MAVMKRSTAAPVSSASQPAFSFPSTFTANSFQPNAQTPAVSRLRSPPRIWPHCGGRGFGTPSPPPPPPPPPQSPEVKVNNASWADKYKAYVKRNGRLLCAMAWEGYERLGRGAVFANYDDSTSAVAFIGRGARNMKSANASFYVDRDKLVEKNKKELLPQMNHILQRIASYDPQKQFVVVFEADGVQGVDIVTPNQPPSDVWAKTRRDGGKMFDWQNKK